MWIASLEAHLLGKGWERLGKGWHISFFQANVPPMMLFTLQLYHTMSKVMFGNWNIMAWAIISSHGTGRIHKIEGAMDGAKWTCCHWNEPAAIHQGQQRVQYFFPVLFHLIPHNYYLWTWMLRFLFKCWIFELIPMSGRNVQWIASLEMYLLRKKLTRSILISPTVHLKSKWPGNASGSPTPPGVSW